MPVFKVEEEMGYEGGLIPDGTIVLCEIHVPNVTPKQSNNDANTSSLDIELTVNTGQYAGSKFYDRIGVKGKDAYVTMGKQKVMYALEISRNAHVTNDYNLETWGSLNGMYALVKVGVETYLNTKQSRHAYKNVAKAYGSPRTASRNYKYWEAYHANTQPWQTDKLPPLPTSNGAESYQGGVTGHLDADISL